MTGTNPMSCEQCGQTHVRCTSHKKDGNPCNQPPMNGQRVCRKHGGKAPQNLAAAERRISEQKARAAVEKLNLRREIHPNDALLEEVYRSAGVVAWLDVVVRQLDADAMVWGVTQEVEKGSGEHPGTDTTYAAQRNAWVVFWQDERKHLVVTSKAALDAGIDERRVRLAESQGAMVADVMKRIGEAILAALLSAGMPERFAGVFRDSLREVAPRELRALASGGEA